MISQALLLLLLATLSQQIKPVDLKIGDKGSITADDSTRESKPEYRGQIVPLGTQAQINFKPQNCTDPFNLLVWHTNRSTSQEAYSLKPEEEMRLWLTRFHIWYMFDTGSCTVNWEVTEADPLLKRMFNKWTGIIYHSS